MTDAGWAEKKMEAAFQRWASGEQFDGWMEPFTHEVRKEHARAIRLVKAAYKKTWKQGYTNEAYREGRLNMAQDFLTALQRGRGGKG